jgi:hypothetical protein
VAIDFEDERVAANASAVYAGVSFFGGDERHGYEKQKSSASCMTSRWISFLGAPGAGQFLMPA